MVLLILLRFNARTSDLLSFNDNDVRNLHIVNFADPFLVKCIFVNAGYYLYKTLYQEMESWFLYFLVFWDQIWMMLLIYVRNVEADVHRCSLGVPKDFASFTGKHLCCILFLITMQDFRPSPRFPTSDLCSSS